MKIIRNKYLIKFALSGIFWFLIVVAFKYFDRYFHLLNIASKLTFEFYIGLILTVVTGVGGWIWEYFQKRQQLISVIQDRNYQLIVENHEKTIKLLHEYEDGTDAIIIRLNVLDKHEAQLDSIRDDVCKLNTQFADIDQRQKQGDRLLYLLDIVAKLIDEVASLRTEQRVK